jgi:hypothetical protein
VEFLKLFSIIILILFGIMGIGAGTLATDDHVRIWVDVGDNTITYDGKVVEVTDTDVVMNVENSATGYYERDIGGYTDLNPVTIRKESIFAYAPQKEGKGTDKTPGVSPVLVILIIMMVGGFLFSRRK